MTSRQALLIELIDPVITSLSAASAGTPEALKYIPGALIHGAVASRAYRAGCKSEEAFVLFHSGKVRFGDALPINAAGEVGWPIPMSFQFPKGGKNWDEDKDKLIWSEDVVDGSEQHLEEGYQWKPVKCDAVSSRSHEIKLSRGSSMRTAIDPDEGRAANSQLFGYEFLKPPQRFVAFLEAENAELLEKALNHAKEGQYILGRAKSAEFGRVRISKASAVDVPSFSEAPASYIWCLSDFWVAGERGLPISVPTDTTFGAKIDWSRSFMLTRRVSPYNAKWSSRGIEREVVQRGKEIGCGWMIASAEPPREILGHLSVVVGTSQNDEQASLVPNVAGLNKGLAERLLSQSKQREFAAPDPLIDELCGHYRAAQSWNGKRVGPQPSQWGALRNALESGADIEHLLGDPGARKERDGWDARFASGEAGTFGAWVRSKVNDETASNILPLVARGIRDRLKSGELYNDK